MEKVKVELTEQELEMVYTGLLELPAKYSLPLIHNIKDQVVKQEGNHENGDIKKVQ